MLIFLLISQLLNFQKLSVNFKFIFPGISQYFKTWMIPEQYFKIFNKSWVPWNKKCNARLHNLCISPVWADMLTFQHSNLICKQRLKTFVFAEAKYILIKPRFGFQEISSFVDFPCDYFRWMPNNFTAIEQIKKTETETLLRTPKG